MGQRGRRPPEDRVKSDKIAVDLNALFWAERVSNGIMAVALEAFASYVSVVWML